MFPIWAIYAKKKKKAKQTPLIEQHLTSHITLIFTLRNQEQEKNKPLNNVIQL